MATHRLQLFADANCECRNMIFACAILQQVREFTRGNNYRIRMYSSRFTWRVEDDARTTVSVEAEVLCLKPRADLYSHPRQVRLQASQQTQSGDGGRQRRQLTNRTANLVLKATNVVVAGVQSEDAGNNQQIRILNHWLESGDEGFWIGRISIDFARDVERRQPTLVLSLR